MNYLSKFQSKSLLPNGEESERNVPVSSIEVSKSNAVVSVGSLNGNEEGSIDTSSDAEKSAFDCAWANKLLSETKANAEEQIALIAQGQKENLQNFQVTHKNQAAIMENQKVTSEKLDYLLTHATPNGKNYLNRLKKESEKKKRASQKKSNVPSSTPVVRGMDKHVKQQSQSTKAKAEAKKRDGGRILA